MKSEESKSFPMLYDTAVATWHALLADLSSARHDISIEQYILADDEAGRPFFDLLIQKAREGVSVRLILDAVGSNTLRGSDTLLQMIEAGVQVHFYNEIGVDKIFNPRRWFPRTHCKNFILDDRLAYVGSACIAEEMRDWRELHMRTDDPAVIADVKNDFDSLWNSMKAGKRLSIGRGVATSSRADGDAMRYVSSRRARHKANPLYRELLWHINHAHTHVRLATPYFMPPYRLRRALKRAARRGVEVTLLMSEKTDVRIADWVARFYYPRLIRSNIRIVNMTQTIMHAKYMIVDDSWASIGSTNLDYLSLFRNREANIVTIESAVIDDMISVFDHDAAAAREARLADYPARELFLLSIEYVRALGRRVLARGS